MRISCPECDAVLKSAEHLPAGKAIRCPKCECSFRVPAARKGIRADDDDDDDEEDIPRRRTKRRKEKQSSGTLLIGSIVAGCVVLFAVIGVVAYFGMSKL